MKDKIKRPGLIGNKNAVGNSGGRPQKLKPDDETLKTLANLGKMQCTTKECAAFLEVSEPTFFEFLKRFKEAEEALERGKENGKSSLRRLQFKSAQDGNVTMQIWLGKQLLGQKDKQEVSSDPDAPLKIEIAWAE